MKILGSLSLLSSFLSVGVAAAVPSVQPLATPTVTLTAPVFPNNILTGLVTLTAEAGDDAGVTGVEFYADDSWLGVDTTAP